MLRGLDIEVKPGQYVALVGSSGCGKSTAVQLIERFYDPLVGQVLVDGMDIAGYNLSEYRRNISLVSQEPTYLLCPSFLITVSTKEQYVLTSSSGLLEMKSPKKILIELVATPTYDTLPSVILT